MANKHRKPGDWKAVAKSRESRARQNRTGRGLTNIPDLSETGSAAYRRLQRRMGDAGITFKPSKGPRR